MHNPEAFGCVSATPARIVERMTALREGYKQMALRATQLPVDDTGERSRVMEEAALMNANLRALRGEWSTAIRFDGVVA